MGPKTVFAPLELAAADVKPELLFGPLMATTFTEYADPFVKPETWHVVTGANASQLPVAAFSESYAVATYLKICVPPLSVGACQATSSFCDDVAAVVMFVGALDGP